MIPTLSLAVLSAKTILNRRFLLLLFITGILLATAILMAAAVSLEQNERVVVDLTLAGIPLILTTLFVIQGAYQFASELERGTAALLVVQPISRGQFVIGKFLGTILAAAGAAIIMTTTVLVFLTLTAGWPLALSTTVLALAFRLLELVVLVAVAFLLATLTGPPLATFLTAAVWIIGHTLQLILFAGQQLGGAVATVSATLYYLLPNLQKFAIQDTLAAGEQLSSAYIGWTLLYALLYSAAILLLTVIALRRREW